MLPRLLTLIRETAYLENPYFYATKEAAMYVPVQSPPPSAQAMDLGQRIASTVRTYLAENPGIGSTDVSQAFMVAKQHLQPELGGLSQQKMILLVVVILGVLALGLAVVLNSGEIDSSRIPMVAIAAAIMGIAFVIVAFSKKGL